MVWRVFKGLRAFRRDRRGNVAMMWGLLGAGLIGLIGLTVDFTRAQAIRTQLQNAADGAALAAARAPANLTLAARTTAARAFFDAEAGEYGQGATFSLTPAGDQGYRVNVSTSMEGGLTRLISNHDWDIGVESEAVRGGVNLEVALVLDTTGSMSGSKISALRTAATDLVNTVVQDTQTPYYSKLALISYSVGVNAGSYAASVRGAIPSGHNISGAAWQNGSTSRSITAITKANPGVFTSNGHGYAVGDVVWLSGVTGTSNWATNLNNDWYTIATVPNANTFTLNNSSGQVVRTNGSSYSGSYPGGGILRRCLEAACQVRVTANSHGLSNGAETFITGVNGMTQINNATGSGSGTVWTVANATTNTFALSGSVGPTYSNYSSGGQAYCAAYGCQYYHFTNASGGSNVFQVSTCVTERAGAQAYTDVAPSSSLVSLNYPSTASQGSCPSNTVLPLTSNRTTINSRISGLSASGYTAGQIGAAWGWYMLSPNFSYLWPGASAPAAYGTPETLKVMVLMTDGAFNSSYCNGVIARDTSGAGNNVDHINCNATNGDPLDQALSLCTAMKNRNVVIYTVGFQMSGESQASKDMMHDCASNPANAFMADDSAQLLAAFQQIAQSISQLRLTH